MSPTTHKVGGSSAPTTPEAKVTKEEGDGQYGGTETVKVSPKTENPQEKLLGLPTDLAERQERLEASQLRQEEADRLSSRESSVFESAIGLGRPMARHALDKTPPPHDSLMSPGTYFGATKNGYDQEAAANVETVQAPQSASPQHFVPPQAYRQPVQPPVIPQAPMNGFMRVPDTRQRKLAIRPFDGKELYQGLGSSFLSWGTRFVRQIGFAERASGFKWSEEIKIDVLGHHLTGMAERYYHQQRGVQRSGEPGAGQHRPLRRPWDERVHTITAEPQPHGLPPPGGGAGPLRAVEIQLRTKHIGHDVVNDVHEGGVDTHNCFRCGKQGHLKAACKSKRKGGGKGGGADYVLAVDHDEMDKDHRILDTGSSRHFVNDVSLLEDAEDFESQCIAADGRTVKVTKRGSVMLETTVMGKKTRGSCLTCNKPRASK
ncbi:unnamed protein product [Phytophthora lilii]|uniref:Unnamed protein product n=1 Tax=Phytophthora lilii TaxID=2077276 RepID=A0A9W6UD58_9STRA|nr:unnamed protein product [Phytophthora lilii]